MRISPIQALMGVAVVGFTVAIGLPAHNRKQEQSERNALCQRQYTAALAAGVKLPEIKLEGIRHEFLSGARREKCSAEDGSVTWDPSNNLLSLYQNRQPE